jgi:cytoskeletal protein CcmA (bactofilin family)
MADAQDGAVIAADAFVSGNVKGQNLTVLGGLEGEVTLSGRLRVGREGRVKARVRAKEVVVEGEVEGELTAQSLTVLETARARGIFVSKQLVVKEGALVEGQINPVKVDEVTPPPAPSTDLPKVAPETAPADKPGP